MVPYSNPKPYTLKQKANQKSLVQILAAAVAVVVAAAVATVVGSLLLLLFNLAHC